MFRKLYFSHETSTSDKEKQMHTQWTEYQSRSMLIRKNLDITKATSMCAICEGNVKEKILLKSRSKEEK